MATDWQQMADELGLKGMTKADAPAIAQLYKKHQAAGGGGGGILGGIEGAVGDVVGGGERAYRDTLGQLTPAAQDVALLPVEPARAVQQEVEGVAPGIVSSIGKDIFKKSPPAKKGAQKKATVGDPVKAAAPITQQSPFEQMANALAQSYLSQTQQLSGLVSGTAAPAMEQAASQAAATNLAGQGPGGALGAAGLAQLQGSAPAPPMQGAVNQAMQAQGNAQAAGALGYAGNIAGMGQAETQYLATAPYQQLLTELVNEASYRAANPSYGASALGLNTKNTPPWLQSTLQKLGIPVGPATGAPGASGLTTPAIAAPGGTGTTPNVNAKGTTTGGG